MKLNDYQTGAIRTAIYPGKLAYPTLGLCGEVGELTAACILKDKKNTPKEIGDVLWYVANVAADAGLQLSEVCKRKTFSYRNKARFWDRAEACENLTVEAGVVAENVKKTIRDHDGVLQENRQANIKRALKAVVLALASIARDSETTLEKCAKMNLDKLRSRQERGKLKGSGDDR